MGVEGLNDQDRFRFGAQIYTMYCHFEMVYHLSLKGTVEQDEVTRAMLLIRALILLLLAIREPLRASGHRTLLRTRRDHDEGMAGDRTLLPGRRCMG